ncbi:hypothetical protein H257_07403 [Aphanomyces astaci]|uniref:Uncharacterized protein n=1 Tax=Aphanomyces astaci TaxID=112090 RepID=W4GJ71_APHAT|nr:hypothetical protein H257_07403 [Aphanomyces astaci]ETV79376.1 hypothetical protein H257_07403 [Aphanomyces astaci]|eukprot:XP_009831217.1 hypothetical protein H257_07403 [Aphanomyces astaci]
MRSRVVASNASMRPLSMWIASRSTPGLSGMPENLAARSFWPYAALRLSLSMEMPISPSEFKLPWTLPIMLRFKSSFESSGMPMLIALSSTSYVGMGPASSLMPYRFLKLFIHAGVTPGHDPLSSCLRDAWALPVTCAMSSAAFWCSASCVTGFWWHFSVIIHRYNSRSTAGYASSSATLRVLRRNDAKCLASPQKRMMRSLFFLMSEICWREIPRRAAMSTGFSPLSRRWRTCCFWYNDTTTRLRLLVVAGLATTEDAAMAADGEGLMADAVLLRAPRWPFPEAMADPPSPSPVALSSSPSSLNPPSSALRPSGYVTSSSGARPSTASLRSFIGKAAFVIRLKSKNGVGWLGKSTFSKCGADAVL